MDIKNFATSAIILSSILTNHSFAGKVVPYVAPDLFEDSTERATYETILSFASEYNKFPSKNEVMADMRRSPNLERFDKDKIGFIFGGKHEYENEWLKEKTEEWVNKRKVDLTINSLWQRFQDGEELNSGPKELQDALSFTFDNSIGHNYIEDYESRWEAYTSEEDKVKFGLKMFDRITNGGIGKGTLNMFVAGPGVNVSAHTQQCV